MKSILNPTSKIRNRLQVRTLNDFMLDSHFLGTLALL